MYKKINKNKLGVIEYAIDREEDLDDIKIDNVDNTVYATMNSEEKELIYLYSSYAKKWILINDTQEIDTINEQLDNIDREKADKSTTINLQGQIDSLVVNGTGDSNPEVVQARAGYGLLVNRINDIKSSKYFDYLDTPLSKGYSKSLEFNFELGYLDSATGEEKSSTKTARTTDFYVATGDEVLFCDFNGGALRKFEYDGDGNYVFQEVFYSGDTKTLKDGYKYRFTITNPTTTVITIDEARAYLNLYSSKDLTDNFDTLKNKIDEVKNITINKISGVKFFGHKGGSGGLYPQNTVENVRNCFEKGFTHLECDVLMTLDRIPVISHNNNMIDKISGNTITITQTNYSDLLAKQFWDDDSIKLPTLTQIMRECRYYNLGLALEFKGYDFTKDEIEDVVKKSKVFNLDTYYMCFSSSPLTKVRMIDENAKIAYLFSSNPTIESLNSDTAMQTYLSQKGTTLIFIDFSNNIDISYLENLEAKNLGILMATMDNEDTIKSYLKYCYAVTSNIYGRFTI